MKIKIIIGAGILIVLAGAMFVFYKQTKEQQPVVCATDTKICPDESVKVRKGPQCEFDACSAEAIKSNGTLKGSVTIGPVCPVGFAEKYPTFSCKPTPEMYAAAKVFVYKMDKTTLVTTVTPDKYGLFSITLPEGSYFIDMIHQKMGGTKGVPTTVTITKDKPVTLNLDVDTGLR
ncbi:MAG: hypothetical protein WCT07_01725 [Candidatus Paceibacterota bacterium]|jgi:hypothetical protein